LDEVDGVFYDATYSPCTMYIYILWRVPIYDITSMEMDKSTRFLRARLSNSTGHHSIFSKVTSEAFDIDATGLAS
jgi:hypothetical protein